MPTLSAPDAAALAFFAFAWIGYSFAVRRVSRGAPSLNRLMDVYRLRWMREMAKRENRIPDSSIVATLQNGAAFFGSTSLIAIGGAAAMMRSGDDVLNALNHVSAGLAPDRGVWEVKVVGLLLIFGYAFFKFAWAYRLFNFCAILVGATPSRSDPDVIERDAMAARAARMQMIAGSHFSRGQRAFFFALAYLGWFLGPLVFIAMTAFVLAVMWMRQFHSNARAAIRPEEGSGKWG